MIQGLHHIAIIASSEKSIEFYSSLGFREKQRMERGYDTVVLMGGVCVLEIYIDPTHPRRVTDPEAFGLRHLAFEVRDLDEIEKVFDCEPIRETAGRRYTFTKDPDGLPIELCEWKCE